MTDIQEMSVRQLHKAPSEDTLWACVEAFQNERFRTVSGLPYSYHLKIGRRGVYTKELFVDRREKSKSITWKTVMQAFEAVRQEKKERPLIARPKALGDVRGISYIYPIFYRIGLIDVPENFGQNMEDEDPDKLETAFESRLKDEIRGFFNERKNVEDNAVMQPKA